MGPAEASGRRPERRTCRVGCSCGACRWGWGTGVVAISVGLVRVQVAGQIQAIGYGEVPVADRHRVGGAGLAVIFLVT